MGTRVILINAPTIKNQFVGSDNYFPLGLLSLGTVLKKDVVDVKIVDVNNKYYMKELNEAVLNDYVENTLNNFIRNYNPDIVGIGCTFSGAFKSLKIIAKKIKGVFADLPIAIGGVHPTIFSREILKKYNFIDYVIVGEGEKSFAELVKHIAGDKVSLESIDGLAYRDRVRDAVKLNPKMKFEDNLDALPFIDYSLINTKEYAMDTSNWYSPKNIKIDQPFSIISSRSCPQKCSFCSMWLIHGTKTRVRSASNVLDEIETLYKDYNVRYFEFMDDNMTFSKERTLEICRGIIKRKLDIQFSTPNGLAMNRLDEEVIDALVEAGMIWVSLAPESGSEFIRNKVMRKGLSNKKVYEIVMACANHKRLFIKAFFIIGMPEESVETLEETYEMIKRLPFDKIAVYFATAYPGTELFDYCMQHKLLPSNKDYVDVTDLQGRADKPHFRPHNLSIEDLIRFRERCYDCLREKRRLSGLPGNYPLRYRG